MTARDRGVLIGIATLAVLGAVWFMFVAPEREKASKLGTSVSAASAQLATAESELANARQAQTRYTTAYASIVNLGKAVPPAQEVPSLIYQLDQASNQKRVEFNSIASGASGASGGSAGASGSGGPSGASATSAATSTVFTQMPFTFVFNGGFFDLEHLFQQLNRFTQRTASGSLQISGRLLTVQSVKLAPLQNAGAAAGPSGVLSGTITATAYVLPASQGLTAGASPTAPSGVGASSSSSSPTTPAIARVTP
jgi:Tfp pilus assembly protein PilO